MTTAVLLGAASTLGGVSACSRAKPGPSKRGEARLAAAFKTPEAGAVALCSAIHELPQARRAACCVEAPRALYYDECVRLLSSAVRAGHVEVDASKVGACRARVDAETLGCDWVTPTLGAAPAECASAISGKLGAGERCSSSLECAGAMHCAGQGATSPGTCKPPQALGAGCGATVDSLATYLALRGLETTRPDCTDFCSLPSHRCEPVPVEGAACHASANCARDQICTAGHCGPPPSNPAPRTPAASTKKCASDRTALLAPAAKPLALPRPTRH